MTRYHFNVEDGLSVPDPTGTELANMDEARREAVRLMGGLVRDDPDCVWRERDWQMVVTDDTGLTLFTIQVLANDAPAAQARGRR